MWMKVTVRSSSVWNWATSWGQFRILSLLSWSLNQLLLQVWFDWGRGWGREGAGRGGEGEEGGGGVHRGVSSMGELVPWPTS